MPDPAQASCVTRADFDGGDRDAHPQTSPVGRAFRFGTSCSGLWRICPRHQRLPGAAPVAGGEPGGDSGFAPAALFSGVPGGSGARNGGTAWFSPSPGRRRLYLPVGLRARWVQPIARVFSKAGFEGKPCMPGPKGRGPPLAFTAPSRAGFRRRFADAGPVSEPDRTGRVFFAPCAEGHLRKHLRRPG